MVLASSCRVSLSSKIKNKHIFTVLICAPFTYHVFLNWHLSLLRVGSCICLSPLLDCEFLGENIKMGIEFKNNNTLSFFVLSNYILNGFEEILSSPKHIPKKHKANHAFKTEVFYFIFVHPPCWKSLENANILKNENSNLI